MAEKPETLHVEDPDIAVADHDQGKDVEGHGVEYTKEEEKQLVRKLDLILIPIMALGTGLQLVDKSALGSAATLTIVQDIGLVGSQYSWAVSIYYFGLMVGTYPANLLLQRFHSGKVIAIAFLCWGSVILGTAGVKSFPSLAALRFFLGIFESAMAPGFTAATARFYSQAEQPLRFSLWTLANTVFPIPFLVVFYGIGGLSDHPLQPWRWIFILLGILTIFIGVAVLIVFPDTPETAWWLTPRQREICLSRVARSQTGHKDQTFKKYQIIEAVSDVKAWLVCAMLIFQQSGVSLQTNFSGIIIKGFGYSGLKSLLLQIPGWAVATIGVVITGFAVTHVKRMRQAKTIVLSVVAAIAVACIAVLYTHPPAANNKAASLAVLSLFNLNAIGYPIILSLVGQNFAGTSKRQTVLTMVFISYCVSNICLPQAFLSSQSPRYQDGLLTVLCFQVTYILVNIVLYLIAMWDNSKRDRAAQAATTEGQVAETGDESLEELDDETDKRNPKFRYIV